MSTRLCYKQNKRLPPIRRPRHSSIPSQHTPQCHNKPTTRRRLAASGREKPFTPVRPPSSKISQITQAASIPLTPHTVQCISFHSHASRGASFHTHDLQLTFERLQEELVFRLDLISMIACPARGIFDARSTCSTAGGPNRGSVRLSAACCWRCGDDGGCRICRRRSGVFIALLRRHFHTKLRQNHNAHVQFDHTRITGLGCDTVWIGKRGWLNKEKYRNEKKSEHCAIVKM